VTTATQTLESGRGALKRRAWAEAVDAFSRVGLESLAPEDLQALADAAWWAGDPDLSTEAYEKAYSGYVEAGRKTEAASIAVLLAQLAARRLAMAIAAGWHAKAARLLEGVPESAAHAELKVMDLMIALLFEGDPEKAISAADEAIEIARRTGARDAEAEAMVFKGRAMVGLGEWREGLALIDEAAATALSGDVELRSASNVYCCTIDACRSLGDYRRATEWTEEADRWMSRQSVGGYPGVCQLHRAELKRLKGSWSEAEDEALQACSVLERYHILDAVGLAHYQVGEIRLLMGDYDGADAAFSRAFEQGVEPQPGLARLMLARGQRDEAARALERALTEVGAFQWDLLGRVLLLPAQVEVALARDDVDTARGALAELEQAHTEFGRVAFEAAMLTSRGQISLHIGDYEEALQVLQRAFRLWREVEFPYEAAKVRMLLAQTHEGLADSSRARMELDAAKATFESLGAKPDSARVNEMLGSLDRMSMAKVRATRALLFTDIVTSTDLIGVIGDAAWESLITWHDRELRSIFAEHGGAEANHAGDGFFVVFDSADEAVDAAISIQRRLIDHRREHGFAPSVRIGIHVGEVTTDGGEYRGQSVHLAARIAGVAEGEEIVISESAVAEGTRRGISEGRTVALKGIAEPVVVHSVDWR
jgi:class 3 adenylate cyclase